jgi:hypothetical protein
MLKEKTTIVTHGDYSPANVNGNYYNGSSPY